MATNATDRFIGHLRRIVLFSGATGPTDAALLGRFIDKKDELAFELLMRRHGPMVLGVCRRLLRNAQDAEDAFQATFLVLVRKAASVWPREMVGNWLYGVAHQTAIRSRSQIVKRKRREKQVSAMPDPQAPSANSPGGSLGLLDQELSRLPDKFRTAIVLCDLEGKTRAEAARQLGWPEGSVSGRLARGRAMLAKRLTKHGPALSVGVLAAELSQIASATTVPGVVVLGTTKAACVFAAGQTAAKDAISAHVAALAEGMILMMNLKKWTTATVAVFLLTGLGTGLGWGGIQLGQSVSPQKQAAAGDDKPSAQTKLAEVAPQKTDKERIVGVWRAKTVEQDGKDISGADVTGFVDFAFASDGKWTMRTYQETKIKSTIAHYDVTGPGKIDLEFKPNMTLAIYRFDGDNRLTLCFPNRGDKSRPTVFATEKGDSRTIWYLVRVRPGELWPLQRGIDQHKAEPAKPGQ